VSPSHRGNSHSSNSTYHVYKSYYSYLCQATGLQRSTRKGLGSDQRDMPSQMRPYMPDVFAHQLKRASQLAPRPGQPHARRAFCSERRLDSGTDSLLNVL